MALVTTAKAASANSNTPSQTITRQEVSVARPTTSTARVQALKDRIAGKPAAPVAQPVANRPAGSSARREEMAKLQKFNTPAPQQQQKPQVTMKTSARSTAEDFGSIAPPPSGLAPGQTAPAQPDPSVEVPVESTEVTSAPVDPQHAALIRKERQLRTAQKELKAAQDAWKQQQAEYVPKNRISTETLKVLAEAGITPDKLVELQINQANPDPNQALHNKIAELEAKLNGITDPENGSFAQRDKQAYDQAVRQIQSDVDLLVESNPSYGAIKSEGQSSEVTALITAVFEEEGVVLDVEEAAQLVEDKLQQRLEDEFKRLNKYEWLRAKYGKQSENAAEASPAKSVPQQRLVNTLTNAGASTRPLSARDKAVMRVQAAINASKGK